MNRTTKKLIKISFLLIILAVYISPVSAEGQILEFGVPAKGNFTVYGEVHSYYFDGNAGDTILVTLAWGGSGNVWASFELYSPNGVLMNSSQGPTAKATNKLPVDGRYTISAGTTGPAWSSWGPGPYVLTVQRVAFGSSPTTAPPETQATQLTHTSSGNVQPTPISESSISLQNTIPAFVIPGLFLVVAIVAGLGIAQYMRKKGPSGPGTISSQTPAIASSSVSAALVRAEPHHDIFISYASADKPVADAVCNSLESQKIRCWIAPRDILPGMNFQESIIDAIDSSLIMVLVFSSHSNTSPHVITEVTEAMSKGVIIIPFRIEDVAPSQSMKYLISVPHWLDAMTPPLEQHIDELSRTIQVILKQKRGQMEKAIQEK